MDVVGALLVPVWSEVVAECLGDLPQPLHQHHRLDKLHVAELGVPVDVGGADEDVLPHLLPTNNVNSCCQHYNFT